MRCWRPCSVVLALLSGCFTSNTSEPAPPAPEPASPPVEAQHLEPCGTTATLLGDASSPAGAAPEELVHGGSTLLFVAEDGKGGRALWSSSGTHGAGTALVKDFEPGETGVPPGWLTRVGNRTFFAAEDTEHGRELWVTDGTPGGTRLVKDIWPGPTGSFPRSLFEYKGAVYFAAGDPEHGRELWRSDGTPEGTVLVEDFDPGPEGTSPENFVVGGDGALYFVINRGFERILMRGTGGPGATEVFHIAVEGGLLDSVTPVGNRLFFVAGELHDEMIDLMVTDGRATAKVASFADIGELAAMGGRLYFSATSEGGTDGAELWRSDGTAKGTRRVKDLQPGAEGSAPGGFQVLGKQLLFTADDGTHGRELWTSDGTEAGTRLLADLEPGEGGSSPEELTVVEGRLFFSAETAGHGREAWMSDGKPGGTVALGEVAPGEFSSDPSGFVRSGWDIFFSADDGTHGPRLWALPVRPSGQCGAATK